MALWISSVLLLLIGGASSVYDDSICSNLKKSYGLIPPPLPTNFELKGEHVDHRRNFTLYEEWHFDYNNQRAKYMFLNKSIEHHMLFDYETSQIVEWDIVHPGVDIKRDPLSLDCYATDMEDSPYWNLFGYDDPSYPRPKMYNSNQALRYGGQYMYAANDTMRLPERGLLVDKFVGCVYDSTTDATMFKVFYFSNEKVEPAGATPMGDVLGFDDGFMSVPVKFQTYGAMPRNDVNKTVDIFNMTYSISWFKAEPEFQVGTFQIPPWVYCTDFQGRKDIPKFPTAFSTRLLVTQFQIDTMGEMAAAETQSYETIFYYGEKNLARRDYSPNPFMDSEVHSKFQNYAPVSTIYDFNQGLRYTINKPSGRCYIGPIYDNDYFDTHEQLLYRKLAPPEEIFLMETDEMEYKGTAFARDIDCNVWTGKYFDERYNATFIKETYISTNGWHELADEMVEYGVPVKHIVIKEELNDQLMKGVSTFNFLKFKAKPPPLVLFDINNCVEYIDHQRYAIVLDVSDDARETIQKYRYNFLETVQYYLAEVSQVLTPLRIQRLELRQKRPPGGGDLQTFLVFTLLDKPDLRNIPAVVAVTGSTLKEAVVRLQKLVDSGGFNIEFHPPGSKDVVSVFVNPGEFYVVTAGGGVTAAPVKKIEREASKSYDTIIAQHDDEFKVDDFPVEVIELKGMTSGHLALLGCAMVFIGIGIGIATMYLYVRMYSDRKLEDRINLTYTKSDENNVESATAIPSKSTTLD